MTDIQPPSELKEHSRRRDFIFLKDIQKKVALEFPIKVIQKAFRKTPVQVNLISTLSKEIPFNIASHLNGEAISMVPEENTKIKSAIIKVGSLPPCVQVLVVFL